jgi:hypothetical protein
MHEGFNCRRLLERKHHVRDSGGNKGLNIGGRVLPSICRKSGFVRDKDLQRHQFYQDTAPTNTLALETFALLPLSNPELYCTNRLPHNLSTVTTMCKRYSDGPFSCLRHQSVDAQKQAKLHLPRNPKHKTKQKYTLINVFKVVRSSYLKGFSASTEVIVLATVHCSHLEES